MILVELYVEQVPTGVSLTFGIALLAVMVAITNLFGPGGRTACMFCGSRNRKHDESCPWSKRQHR